jgi:hypothetical protein
VSGSDAGFCVQKVVKGATNPHAKTKPMVLRSQIYLDNPPPKLVSATYDVPIVVQKITFGEI